jgi:hypothetical protein
MMIILYEILALSTLSHKGGRPMSDGMEGGGAIGGATSFTISSSQTTEAVNEVWI